MFLVEGFPVFTCFLLACGWWCAGLCGSATGSSGYGFSQRQGRGRRAFSVTLGEDLLVRVSGCEGFLTVIRTNDVASTSRFIRVTRPTLSGRLGSLRKCFNAGLVVAAEKDGRLVLASTKGVLCRGTGCVYSLRSVTQVRVSSVDSKGQNALHVDTTGSHSSVFVGAYLRPFRSLFPGIICRVCRNDMGRRSRRLLSNVARLNVLDIPLVRRGSFRVLFRERRSVYTVFSGGSGFLASVNSGRAISVGSLTSLPLYTSTNYGLVVGGVFGTRGLGPGVLDVYAAEATTLR